MMEDCVYPGGFAGLMHESEAQRIVAFAGMQDLLEELSAGSVRQWMAEPVGPDHAKVEPPLLTARAKFEDLCANLAGKPRLVAVHALLNAAARRTDPPALAQAMFLDMWKNHSRVMLDVLDTRWRISALKTFAVFGETAAQRGAAAQIALLLDMMKLYETERLYSAREPDQPFRRDRRIDAALPMDFAPYSVADGDLDRNLLAGLWAPVERDLVLRPLACGLLNQLIREPRGLFYRLGMMRRIPSGK